MLTHELITVLVQAVWKSVRVCVRVPILGHIEEPGMC